MHASTTTDFATTFLLEAEAVVEDTRAGEGHGSEVSRGVSRAILMPHGRPGAWVVFVVAMCTYVVAQAVALRFA